MHFKEIIVSVLTSIICVNRTPEGEQPPSGVYVRSTETIHGIDIVVYDDDPYYSVHFVKNGKSLANENLIINLDNYMREVYELSDTELLEKISVV